jgi:CheY-like chemotaxis protein/CBS domain-containing protein
MLRVQELMTPRPRTVREDTPLIVILDLMVKERFEHVPVVDESGHLMGIVSDRDLKSSLPDRTRPRAQFEEVVRSVHAGQIMTREPITVLPDCPVADAIALMLSCRVGALPVLEHGVLVGLLNQTDVLRRFAEDLSNRATRDLAKTGTIDIDVELGPPRVFALSADQKARTLVTAPLVDAGYMVQSFESLPEMMAVWHLVLPDLLIVDKIYEPNQNLRLIVRSDTPTLWLESSMDRIELSGEWIDTLEIPCSDAVLVRALQNVIGKARMTRDLPSSQSSMPRVLIAEDDHVIRRILQHHLTRHGYELVEANDGREAQACLDDRKFDLILLDINMPYFSGLDLLKSLKEHPQPPKRVILSASHRDETVMKAFALGADDFVKKPFNPEVLIRRLDRLLARA